MRLLQYGARGDDVKRVQRTLHVTADGIFGKQTRAAVVAFQRRRGLEADGVVGPKTLAALFPQAKPPRKRRRRARKAKAAKPRIITAAQIGLRFQYVFAAKGPVYRGAGHYTAGRRCRNAAELVAEARKDHVYHAGKGWGGLSYEAMIADDGSILLGNPTDRKAAAVALNNTGMVGICVPGTTGDRMTDAAKVSVRWLLANWHTRAIPKPHRLPRPARGLDWRGHKEFPQQATACPGVMLIDYKELF